jgi:hypothetical protein
VNVATGLKMPRMNHPLLRRRVVLHTKQRAERLRSRRPDADDAEANTLFYSASGRGGPHWLHTEVAMRGVFGCKAGMVKREHAESIHNSGTRWIRVRSGPILRPCVTGIAHWTL